MSKKGKCVSHFKETNMNFLLLSCKTGGGHDAAANALKEQFESMGHQAFVFDYLTLAGEKVAKRVANTYVKTVQKVPNLFGIVYDIGMYIGKKTHNSPVYQANQNMAKYLSDYLKENHYDAIIMTHLFPAETLTYMKRINIPIPPTYAVLTDYTLTPFWEETECDEYITPHQDLTDEIISRGIPEEKIHPYGIPYSPRINQSNENEYLRYDLNLPINKKIVLLIGGSMGAGNLTKLTKAFFKSSQIDKLYIIVIAGNNTKLLNKLNKKYQGHSSFKIIGHSTEIPNLMKVADIIYTKPGGLTSTEAAASRTPLVLTYEIPGCETVNKKFYIDHRMAVSGKSPNDLVKVGIDLINSQSKCNEMISAQIENVDSNATQRIAEFIIEDTNRRIL